MALNIKVLLTALIFLIVTIVVVFTFVGNSAGELNTAEESITDANNCSSHTDLGEGTKAIYNTTDDTCYSGNSTGEKLYLAGQYDLPLNTLFGTSGVLMLVMMASIMIFIVVISLKSIRKK